MEQIAYGEAYAISESEFLGCDSMANSCGNYWVRHPKEPRLVIAGREPIYVGGNQYNTVANGSSSPVIIHPGQKAAITLLYPGSPRTFAKWKVVFYDNFC